MATTDIVGNLKKTFQWYTVFVYDLEFTTPCWCQYANGMVHMSINV